MTVYDFKSGERLPLCDCGLRIVNAPGDTCARCSVPDVDAEATRLCEASERLVAAAESARLGDTTERRLRDRRWWSRLSPRGEAP